MLPSATAASQVCLSAMRSLLMTRPSLLSMVLAGWTTSLGAGGGAQAAEASTTSPVATASAAVLRRETVKLFISGHILCAEAPSEDSEESDHDDVQQAQFGGLLEGSVVVGVEDRDGQQTGVGGEQEQDSGELS